MINPQKLTKSQQAKFEQETIIQFNELESEAIYETASQKEWIRFEKLGIEPIRKTEYLRKYRIPKDWIKVQKPGKPRGKPINEIVENRMEFSMYKQSLLTEAQQAKLERETIITYNELESEATLMTSSPKVRERMEMLGIKPYREDIHESRYKVPKSWIKVKKPGKPRGKPINKIVENRMKFSLYELNSYQFLS